MPTPVPSFHRRSHRSTARSAERGVRVCGKASWVGRLRWSMVQVPGTGGYFRGDRRVEATERALAGARSNERDTEGVHDGGEQDGTGLRRGGHRWCRGEGRVFRGAMDLDCSVRDAGRMASRRCWRYRIARRRVLRALVAAQPRGVRRWSRGDLYDRHTESGGSPRRLVGPEGPVEPAGVMSDGVHQRVVDTNRFG